VGDEMTEKEHWGSFLRTAIGFTLFFVFACTVGYLQSQHAPAHEMDERVKVLEIKVKELQDEK
jgi:hypothetical protein